MSGSPADTACTAEELTETREELDRRIFHFRILLETAGELTSAGDPKAILHRFLLQAMGPLGAGAGIAVAVPPNGIDASPVFASRGLAQGEEEDVIRAVRSLNESGSPALPSYRSGPKTLTGGMFSHFPAGIHALTACPTASGHTVYFALGKELDQDHPEHEHDLDTLRGLGSVLAGAVDRALSETSVRELNTALAKKTTALSEALNVAKRTQKDRDRRIFHLQTINELNAELAAKNSALAMLDSFLLMSLGTFNASTGFALHLDRQTHEVRFTERGAGMETPAPKTVDAMAYRCLDKLGPQSLKPMTAGLFHPDGDGLGTDLPFKPSAVVFFVISKDSFGLLVLGPMLRGPRLRGAESSLLLTHTDNFMAHLKNALAFELIQRLNEDLENKNRELQAKIDEITECRLEITTLERTKEALRSFIFSEADRMDRVSLLDLTLIPLAAVLIALLFNLTSPNGIPLLPDALLHDPPPAVAADEARTRLDAGEALIVDARPQQLFESGHIPGAINLPPALFDIAYMMKMGDTDPDMEIVVYGRTISSLYDAETARRLAERDHENVRLLDGGLTAWKEAGFPVEADK